MKVYKGYNQKYAETYALPHIIHNGIKCKYYGWCAMVLTVDLVKIDGKIRKFNIKTHEEIFDNDNLFK